MDLSSKLKEIQINASGDQIEKLNQFANLLLKKNKEMNLTSFKERADVETELIVDSLTLYPLNIINDGPILLGQDLGFPLLDYGKVYPVDDGRNGLLNLPQNSEKTAPSHPTITRQAIIGIMGGKKRRFHHSNNFPHSDAFRRPAQRIPAIGAFLALDEALFF